MKRILTLLLALLVLAPVSLRAVYDPEDYKYEIENLPGVSSSTAGYVTLKVWSYGRREKLTRNKCMANAVHGILFKGLDATESGTAGRIAPLVPGGYDTNPGYFNQFFDGAYLQYVQTSNKGTGVKAGDAIKVTKREYKVGMVVKINLTNLRARLEQDGIITGARGFFAKPAND